MPQHKEYAAVASGFLLLLFFWNVFTPANPQHDINIIVMGSLSLVFAICYFLPQEGSQAIQIIVLGSLAILPMTFNEPFFGMVIGVFTMILLYAYNGYRSRPIWKMFVSFGATYWLSVITISYFGPPTIESMARALVWNILTWLFLLFIWRVHSKILEHVINSRLSELNEKLEKQNKRQLNYIAELIERCKNAERQR